MKDVVLEGARVVQIEEKPCHPRSPYAVTGICYDARVFEIIKALKPSGQASWRSRT
jgi:glucose-1-phosphate thymidylyltransferase